MNPLSEFIREIEKSEANVFASCPLDLTDLIDFWKTHHRIGRRKELLDASINKKLQESDHNRDLAQALTREKAVGGAMLLAAATSFQKMPRIQVPDTHHRITGLNTAELLIDWDAKQRGALLQRSIFDGAIYGSVRFHHRMIREYLAARWLHSLLKDGKSRRAIEDLFFKNQYGVEVLVPSMRPLLSWMILFDERFRSRAMDISPEIAIEGGDPSELPTEIRARLLEQFCVHYNAVEGARLSFDLSEVRRFAHPDLAPTISKLLKQYSENEEIRQTLLRMIWQAEIRGCSDVAQEFALNSSMDRYTRMTAIRAISSCGADKQKSELLEHLQSETDDRIIADVIEFLGPSNIHATQLLSFLKRATPEDSESHGYAPIDQAVKS